MRSLRSVGLLAAGIVTAAVSLTLVLAGGGISAGGEASGRADDQTAASPSGVEDGERATAVPLPVSTPICEPPPGIVLRRDIAEVCAAQAQNDGADDPNVISHVPPPANMVEKCRTDFSAESDCGIVLAMADGKLPAGLYTDEELSKAVAAAGYVWP